MKMSKPFSEKVQDDDIVFSEELKSYLVNGFCLQLNDVNTVFLDEPNIEYWKLFSKKATNGENIFNELKKCYPQLNFPIEIDIDKSETYKDFVLRGKYEYIDLLVCLDLENSSGFQFELYESIAGRVPIVTIPKNNDFTALLQSLLYKNNPTPIPQSMGAVLINGIINWERLNTLKKNWLKKNPFGDWSKEFSLNILPKKELYKDKLIVLSTKPYSNVLAEQLGIDEDVWIPYSISIRREHECTHLYTLKKYGKASNNLHDELIADYIGIIKTTGSYNKNWMLKFMGIEEYPKYRKGARLENYIKESKLSEVDFNQLITIVKNAIDNIAIFDKKIGELKSNQDQMCRIDSLCETSLIELASLNGADFLLQKYYEKSKNLPTHSANH